VREILTNPKYVGANVYNRRSCKLDGKAVFNPETTWIRKENSFAAIISQDWFAQAQKIRRLRHTYLNNKEILDRLRALLKRAGRLTTALINDDPTTPSTQTIQAHFGSVLAAYRLIGCQPEGEYHAFKRPLRYVRRNRPVSLPNKIEEAIQTGILSKLFTVEALAKACPGWNRGTYTSFVSHSSVPGGRGTFGFLTLVSRGTYRVTATNRQTTA
jgi:hypothetical protein